MRTETVEVQVPVLVALDPRLTATPPEPPAPPARCRDAAGRTTVCHKDEADWIDALRAWGRGLYNQLVEIRELQP